MPPIPKSNVILFGESGAGKSSIVNMLSSNEHIADISSDARGCTFQSRGYETNVLGKTMTLWDTAGLDEGDEGRISPVDAIVQLYKLLRKLTDGVSLLMFVMRGPRIKGSVPKNWKLISEIICQRQVPIVIVITGLEQEENMDKWWWDNKEYFQKYKILPAGFACITASRGKAGKTGGHKYDDEYEESREKVRRLILSTSLHASWRVPQAEWFSTIAETTFSSETYWWCLKKQVAHEEMRQIAGDALQKLVHSCNMPESEALALAAKMKDI